MWEWGVREDSDEGKPNVGFNKSSVTEVSVGTALSLRGEEKSFRAMFSSVARRQSSNGQY